MHAIKHFYILLPRDFTSASKGVFKRHGQKKKRHTTNGSYQRKGKSMADCKAAINQHKGNVSIMVSAWCTFSFLFWRKGVKNFSPFRSINNFRFRYVSRSYFHHINIYISIKLTHWAYSLHNRFLPLLSGEKNEKEEKISRFSLFFLIFFFFFAQFLRAVLWVRSHKLTKFFHSFFSLARRNFSIVFLHFTRNLLKSHGKWHNPKRIWEGKKDGKFSSFIEICELHHLSINTTFSLSIFSHFYNNIEFFFWALACNSTNNRSLRCCWSVVCNRVSFISDVFTSCSSLFCILGYNLLLIYIV